MRKPKHHKTITNAIAADADDRVRLLERDLASAHRRIANMTARSALVIETVKRILDGKTFVVTVPPAPKADRRKIREERPALSLRDMHFGHYHPNGKYRDSVQLKKQRLHAAVDKFIATTHDRRMSARIEELHLYFLGDIIEGEAMRPGHAWSVEGPVIKQAVFWGPEALCSVIVRLLGEFARIVIKAVPGNHGRNGPPRTESHPESNWDRVCYEVTRLMVTNALLQHSPERLGSIAWDLPSDREASHDCDDWYAVDYLFDWCVCLIHGEDLRGKGWGGIPFYGIERMVRRYADIVDDPIDFMFLGHVHTDAVIPSNYRAAFVNGAIDSSSRYARKELVSATTPSQKAVFFDAEHGAVSHHTLYLSDDHKPHGTRIRAALKRRESHGKAKR